MRAGLIIGGLFLMFVGLILFFTLIFTIFGLFCGLIGFVMLIVGLFTERPTRVKYVYQPPPASYPSQPQYAPQQPYANTTGVKYCTNCGAPNAGKSQYCNRCRKFSKIEMPKLSLSPTGSTQFSQLSTNHQRPTHLRQSLGPT